MPGSSESDRAAEPSARAWLIGALATVGAVVITVYALGSARAWWEGSSCALAACGADDLTWAWYLVAVVGAAVSALMVFWTAQMVRDGRARPG